MPVLIVLSRMVHNSTSFSEFLSVFQILGRKVGSGVVEKCA